MADQNGFMGREGDRVPDMSPEWIEEISSRYIELYERVTGLSFKPEKLTEEETLKRYKPGHRQTPGLVRRIHDLPVINE